MPLITKDAQGPQPAVHDERQLQALIEVFDCITCHTELQELFHDLASRLRRVVSFDFLYVSLYDSVRNVMRVAAVETTSPVTLPVGLEIPEAESPTGFAWRTQQVVVLDDVDHETRFPITRVFVESGIRRVCLLPLTTAQRSTRRDCLWTQSRQRLFEG